MIRSPEDFPDFFHQRSFFQKSPTNFRQLNLNMKTQTMLQSTVQNMNGFLIMRDWSYRKISIIFMIANSIFATTSSASEHCYMLVNVYHVERKTDAPILLADVSKRPRLSWIPELQAKRYQVPRIYRMDLRNAIAFVHCKNAQYAEATEIIEDILKRKNLNFLTALSNMSNGAISHYKLGNHERAEELVKLWLNAPGLAKHIYVHGVANVAIELKLYTLAQELYERSLATYEEFNQSPPKKIISKLTKVYELNGDEKAIAELNSKYPKKITNP